MLREMAERQSAQKSFVISVRQSPRQLDDADAATEGGFAIEFVLA
jgi:hypothetical protein